MTDNLAWSPTPNGTKYAFDFGPLVSLAAIIAFLIINFLPTIIAHARGHHHTMAIFALNACVFLKSFIYVPLFFVTVVFGSTVAAACILVWDVGWTVALVWACLPVQRAIPSRPTSIRIPQYPDDTLSAPPPSPAYPSPRPSVAPQGATSAPPPIGKRPGFPHQRNTAKQ